MAEQFQALEGRSRPGWFASCDPAGPPPGSGGATAQLLVDAWQATDPHRSFTDWLRSSRKLILHAGGQSRHLPAYAVTGKLLLPIPVFRWSRGQRLDQSLLDLQLPDYHRVLAHAGSSYAALITSGDVLLRLPRALPRFPAVDVLGLGMWVTPDKAKDFGVFFTPRSRPGELSFFLQKPAPARIRELETDYYYLVDTGMWLLSERAIRVLMEKCGWDGAAQRFADGRTANYGLYSQFGLSLGPLATEHDPDVNALTCAVVPLPDADFHHFGTSAQMIESVAELQSLVLDETKLGLTAARRYPHQYTQNSRFELPLRREENHSLWVENSVVPATWQVAHEHVFTGVPENRWELRLPPGVCLDFVPVGESDFCVRAYGYRDTFTGRLGDATALWLGRPAAEWFATRGLDPAAGGLAADTDLHLCPLFPVLGATQLESGFLQWIIDGTRSAESEAEAPYHGTEAPYRGTEAPYRGTEVPYHGTKARYQGTEAPYRGTEAPYHGTEAPYRNTEGADCATEAQDCATEGVESGPSPSPLYTPHSALRTPRFAEQWLALPRLSEAELCERVNLQRLYAQRAKLRGDCLVPLMKNFRWSVFHRLDLDSTAQTFAASDAALPELTFTAQDDPMAVVHDEMFRSAVQRNRRHADWPRHEASAFAHLREMIVREAQLSPARPVRSVMEDQIVWARSPIRFDLAGGWTDTPPYCIEHGGKVLNVAADLNGQPPIQVFARLAEKPELVMRSIDLGVEERVRTYEELDTFDRPGSPFALAKAAIALAGFLPRFHQDGGWKTLEAQLRDFGGGLELSLLSAVPKGSGLGTSSILAATVLAALSDLCGLGWDRYVLFTRTLALEQMLTTGGGWQDQAGGIFRGIKLIETSPGLAQKPTLRWLPEHPLGPDYANRCALLYYTGITRMAKNILSEIVRGIFLNSPAHLATIADIGANAEFASAAIQKCDYELLLAAIRNSWRLNQRLDAGTNPPEVQAILNRAGDSLAAAKLLGAGGGGYVLMFAKDEDAASRIKHNLLAQPPNPRARFVEFSVSETGLQVTRS